MNNTDQAYPCAPQATLLQCVPCAVKCPESQQSYRIGPTSADLQNSRGFTKFSHSMPRVFGKSKADEGGRDR